jgi:hypothetical protein
MSHDRNFLDHLIKYILLDDTLLYGKNKVDPVLN